jgi:hypothetical protein
MISTTTFEIVLLELVSGEYCVAYEQNEKVTISEPVRDFNVANHMFEIKLQELEGN